MNWYIYLSLLFGLIIFGFFWETIEPIFLSIYIPILGLVYTKTRGACSVILYRITLPIAIGLAVVCFWIYLHELPDYKTFWQIGLRNYASIQDFFSIVATLYAICIAFLLFKGLTDYDGLRSALSDEASTIQSINDFLFYFEGNPKAEAHTNEIRRLFLKYIKNITAGSKIIVSADNQRFLKKITSHTSKIDPKDENDIIALAEIMKLLSELAHIRSNRSSFMESKMSPFILAIITLMSSAILLPFLMREPDPTFVMHSLIFTISFLFSFLFLTLLDINSPFEGYWSIKVDTFSDVVANIQNDLTHPHKV